MERKEALDMIRALVPNVDDTAIDRLSALQEIYGEWNERLNLVSRKDFDYFYERHVIHCCSIAHWYDLRDSDVMDVGSGGGLPGIPLAILFPQASFTMVDSIGKKMTAVRQMAIVLGLENVRCIHSRAEDLDEQFDYVTGRAVTALPRFYSWVRHAVKWHKGQEASGILYLKGGEFGNELADIEARHQLHRLSDIIDLPYYETKSLLHLYQES